MSSDVRSSRDAVSPDQSSSSGSTWPYRSIAVTGSSGPVRWSGRTARPPSRVTDSSRSGRRRSDTTVSRRNYGTLRLDHPTNCRINRRRGNEASPTPATGGRSDVRPTVALTAGASTSRGERTEGVPRWGLRDMSEDRSDEQGVKPIPPGTFGFGFPAGVTRRGLLAGGGAFALGALLAACGGDDDDDAVTATTGAAARHHGGTRHDGGGRAGHDRRPVAPRRRAAGPSRRKRRRRPRPRRSRSGCRASRSSTSTRTSPSVA